MFFYEGLSCPHCHRRFEEADDVVACPVCGAPHHRDCWKEADGCACREAHGTEHQWSRDAAKAAADKAAFVQSEPAAYTAPTDSTRCPQCGTANSPYAEICAHCGCALHAAEWHSATSQQTPPSPFGAPPAGFNEYAPFHAATPSPCGGVDPHEQIEGETAEDLAAVVRSNANHYLPRFRHIAQSGSKVAWNLAAFLIPHIWLFYRKMPLWGAIATLFEIVFGTVFSVMQMTVFAPAMSENSMMIDYEAFSELIATDERAMLGAMMLMMMLSAYVLYHLLFGLFGTRLYMTTCLKNIRRTRDLYPEGYRAQLSMIGGTSFGLALIGAMCREFIPSMILMLLLR